MISGNVHTNPMTTFQVPNAGINTTTSSMFAARSVKPESTDDLKQDMLRLAGGDEQRAALLEDVAKDGGKARFKQLLDRLRDAAGEHNRPANKFTPVYAPSNQLEARHNDELTRNHKYVRLGDTHPNHLQERENKAGESVYKFKTHVHNGESLSVTNNIELSNCFYAQGRGGEKQDLILSVYRANPELAKRTGAYLNECPAIGKFSYSAEFDANIKTKGIASATIFRLIPHSEGLFFISATNKIRKLNVERNNVEDYDRLVDRGRHFEHSGQSPFTINVENYDGEHFLTIKAGCDYAMFKDADNRCDIPFEGAQTPLFTATCCQESDRQLQDTKYLYVAPLEQGGWFNVKFRMIMPDFNWKENTVTGESKVNILINGEDVVNTNARVGNNNWKAGESYKPGPKNVSEPTGYHVQFGIANASGEMVVKIQDPKITSTASRTSKSDIPFPVQAAIGYGFVSGECQPGNDDYPNSLDGVLKKFGLG